MEWHQIIHPTTVNVILGKKGSGKSCLAYRLVEDISRRHSLLPVVVGFPRDKQDLLPEGYVVMDIEEALATENAVLLIDEGTTKLPAGGTFDELVKSLTALSRQRNQVVLLIFHSSRDIGSKILRGVDVIMLKEPSRRQIEYGSKSGWFRDLLVEAKDRFSKMRGDRRASTYVDSEDPEFRGMMKNQKPMFWSEELSKAWAGVNLASPLEEQRQEEVKWGPEHHQLCDKLETIAKERGLCFNPYVELKGWIVRRVEYGCVIKTGLECPCSNPEGMNCPLLIRSVTWEKEK